MLTPYWSDGEVTLHLGDALLVAQGLPTGSVRTIVTSPPYFGLRDYGTADWLGGDEDCDHAAAKVTKGAATSSRSTLQEGRGGGAKQKAGAGRGRTLDECPACGATKQDEQLGAESTVEAYVANMVALFRELRRVLADDGTLWLNLGDSYAGSAAAGGESTRTVSNPAPTESLGRMTKPGVLKNLLGVPWRTALALQADGWILRSDIIWAKPNPMPESVTDRPTKAHEHLFLLAKQPRYYYDAAAIAEPALGRASGSTGGTYLSAYLDGDEHHRTAAGLRNPETAGRAWETRNRRDVWEISTTPYPGAHFAVMPPDLVRPCIRAGSAPGDTVLDPFSGSGTTGAVATYEGRRYVGIDLNRDFLDLSLRTRFITPTLDIEAIS